ncbi:MAG: hypothetical protein AB8F95_01600 [Bacteroidia bacterium]
MRILLLSFFLLGIAFSQTTIAPTTTIEPLKEKVEERYEGTYQLYFKEKVHKVNKVEYMDGTPIQHNLSPDGETLFLMEYFKRGRVKIFTEDESGEPKVIERSPCYIDPVVES